MPMKKEKETCIWIYSPFLSVIEPKKTIGYDLKTDCEYYRFFAGDGAFIFKDFIHCPFCGKPINKIIKDEN